MRRLAVMLLALLILPESPLAAGGFPPVLRGQTAILLRPEPGPLEITLTKRDLNIYEGADVLTATLTDPWRRTLATITLPDDGHGDVGKAGAKTQSDTIRVACELPGVYRLMTAGSGDLVYGFETNCKRWVLEGLPMFNDGSLSGKIFFPPPRGAFQVAAAALHEPGRQKLPLLDSSGAVIHVFDLTQKDTKPDLLFGKRGGSAYVAGSKALIPADAGNRSGLWAFAVERMDLRIEVAGVRHWTGEPNAWFDATKSRWMLTPYTTAVYLNDGKTGVAAFRLQNSTAVEGRFLLSAQSGDGLALRILEPPFPVTLAANAVQRVRVEVGRPSGAPADRPLWAALSAKHESDPDVVASAGIFVRLGQAPALRPLTMPVVLKPYQHENMLFGYAPDYMTNEVYFDPDNWPYIRQRTESLYTSTGIAVLTKEGWVERPFIEVVRAAYPSYAGTLYGGGSIGAKIAFDAQGGVYTLLAIRVTDGRRPALLIFTPDQGRSYALRELDADIFDIEQFTGHNALAIPPPVLGYRKTRPHHATFCGYYDLKLYMPRREGDKLTLGSPIMVSDNCLGSCQHSGGPASTVTRDGKTHIVWGEVAPDDAPGVPTYVATYDHAAKAAGKKVFLAHGPPVNDVHNVPAITMDTEGYLHILTGAHGMQFKYLRSLKPNDAYSGFTEPVPVLDAGYVDEKTVPKGQGRQTYISLVCGPDDTLHIAYRQWRRNVDQFHPSQTYAALSYQSKPKEGPWGPARPLVIPALPGYSIYYHKLTIDRRGRLYLSYSYWSDDKTYQDDFPGRYVNPAVLTSGDGGTTWKLADTNDFRTGLTQR